MNVQTNQINLHYKKVGTGPALILLHGNGEDHTIFNELAGLLGEHFTVYAIDSRGHGKSTPVKNFNYDEMAQDIVNFINTLKLEKPALYGFSDGGIIGLLIAITHPTLLSKLMVSGANTTPQGLKEIWLDKFAKVYAETGKECIKMLLEQPQIKTADLERIAIPVLVTAGSNDMIDEDHTRYIAATIPQSSLQIYKGETHESYVVSNPMLAKVMVDFLAR